MDTIFLNMDLIFCDLLVDHYVIPCSVTYSMDGQDSMFLDDIDELDNSGDVDSSALDNSDDVDSSALDNSDDMGNDGGNAHRDAVHSFFRVRHKVDSFFFTPSLRYSP